MFTPLDDSIYKSTIAGTDAGVLICFKQQCPHCKNMEKVLEKFSKKSEGVALFNMDSEANPDALEELGAQRAPTIYIIKGGAIVATKAGLMNPKEMMAFYKNA